MHAVAEAQQMDADVFATARQLHQPGKDQQQVMYMPVISAGQQYMLTPVTFN